MEETNVDDSDWGDSDDDLIQDELDGRLDNQSRQQNDEDPLDRMTFRPSASDPFLPVPGPRRSVLVNLNAESEPYNYFCKI